MPLTRWARAGAKELIGSIGEIGCFSFQSNKIINAGEGGILVTDDEMSDRQVGSLPGAYESNCQKHGIQSALFEEFRNRLPLHNARMTNVTRDGKASNRFG